MPVQCTGVIFSFLFLYQDVSAYTFRMLSYSITNIQPSGPVYGEIFGYNWLIPSASKPNQLCVDICQVLLVEFGYLLYIPLK